MENRRDKKITRTDYIEIKTNEPYIKVGHKLKHLSNLTTKDIYNTLIEPKAKPPTSIETWTNMYPFLERHDWKITFQIPFRIIL